MFHHHLVIFDANYKLGIATAFTLQKAGHHVLLIESSDGRSRVSVVPRSRYYLILTIRICRVKELCGPFRCHSSCSVFHAIG